MATNSGKIAAMRELPSPHASTVQGASLPGTVVRVGILWGPACIASTAAAAVDALRAANLLAAMRPGSPAAPLRWHWLGRPGEQGPAAGPVPDPWESAVLRAEPETEPAVAADALDVIVIPGWLVATGPQLREASRWHRDRWAPLLRAHVARGGRVLAVFNGSALLADCGLLAGRRAALPWAFAPSIVLQAQEATEVKKAGGAALPGAPAGAAGDGVLWQRDRAWLRDGGLWTTASLQETTAALLDLLGQTPLAELAQAASHVLLFDAERQLTAPSSMETPTGAPLGAGSLEQARRWLQEHRNEPYSLQATARAAATSPRTLLRWFAQVYGHSPQDYLHHLRVAQAQTLLQTTYLTVDDVAQQCGYGDTGSFRKVFARISGVTPGAYRQRFKLRTARRQWLVADAGPGR